MRFALCGMRRGLRTEPRWVEPASGFIERPPGVGIIVRVHEKTSCFLVADAPAIHGPL